MNTLNIKKLYNNKNTIIESNKYKKYIDYIKLYYRIDAENENKYKREIDENGNYILKHKSNIIKIKRTHVVNINKYYNDLINKINNIYNKISNLIKINNDKTAEKEFDDLKKEYIEIKNNVDSIKEIFNLQDNKLQELNIIKTENEIKLSKLYIKRKGLFKNIKAINIKTKKALIQFYKKTQKIPNDEGIKSISKQSKIDDIVIKEWFLWIDTSTEYIKKQHEINNINKKIRIINEKNKKDNSNFILSPPDFEETKVIKTK
tara:strand:+ start:100 stop:882 length:783 start_codon:yes stop_codon:yes gene_type:complete